MENNWISTKDYLPDDSTKEVLVYINPGGVFMARYLFDKKIWMLFYQDVGEKPADYKQKYISHWMNLPEQPLSTVYSPL